MNQIARYRNAMCISQVQMASLFNVHPMTVSKWERDVSAPNDYTLALIEICATRRDVNVGRMLALMGPSVTLVTLIRTKSRKG